MAGLWLQVASEVFAKAGPLAALLRVDEDRALAMLLRLWRFALDSAPEDGPPTGLFSLQDGPLLIAGACRWMGDPVDLVRALVAVGFVEETAKHMRVRGMSRYGSIWKKNRGIPETVRPPAGKRSRAARKPAGNRTETVRPPAGFPPQEGEGDREEDREEDSSSTGGGDLERGKTSERTSSPEEIAAARVFWSWLSQLRVKDGYLREDPPTDFEAWFSAIFRELRGDVGRLQRAYLDGFAQDRFWAAKHFPIAGFMSQAREYVWPNVAAV